MTASEADRQKRAVRHGDALYRLQDGARATHADFDRPRTAIFIHGFTANAEYMHDLMHQFSGAGFHPLAFEYASFRGIDHAARNLEDLLALFDKTGTIARHRVTLVAHSMGGLVARALVLLGGGARYVKNVVTLGTPHGGTLTNRRVVEYFAMLGEQLSGLNPEGFAPSCASALQLIRADGPNPLLDRLKHAPQPTLPVSFYSISGGYGRLEFGKSSFKNELANSWLQNRLRTPNDGLIEEHSSNLSAVCQGTFLQASRHINNYNEYATTNHSYLINNQTIALLAIQCAST